MERSMNYSRRTAAFCAVTFSAAERRAKLSQHFIHVPPCARTRRLPYITSSLLERSKAKCCVYECYSPFPTNCDWLKTARSRAHATQLLLQPLCMIIYFWDAPITAVPARHFHIKLTSQHPIVLLDSKTGVSVRALIFTGQKSSNR